MEHLLTSGCQLLVHAVACWQGLLSAAVTAACVVQVWQLQQIHEASSMQTRLEMEIPSQLQALSAQDCAPAGF